MILRTIFLVLFVKHASSLMCYICGSSDLQTGECPTQFQYMCSSYARRFPQNERIFCRTLRRRSQNETYTVLKECIAQSEHLKMFPEGKTEGCDTVFDESGVSIAYCVCDGDFCNAKPLNHQMTNVDQVHVPIRATVDIPDRDRTVVVPEANFSVRTGVALKENDLEKGNDGRNPDKAEFLRTAQTTRKPATQLPNQFFNSRLPEVSFWDPKISARPPQIFDHIITKSTTKSHEVQFRDAVPKVPDQPPVFGDNSHQFAVEAPQIHISVKPPLDDRQAPDNRPFHEYHSPPIPFPKPPLPPQYQTTLAPDVIETLSWPNPNAYTSFVPEEEHTTLDTFFEERPTSRSVQGLVCMVCGQGDLTAPNVDCANQYAVDCAAQFPPGTSVYCFSRHTVVEQKNHAIEKQCVSDTSLIQEYGEGVQMDGCATAWGSQVDYCVCSTNKCNEMAIRYQMDRNRAKEAEQPGQSVSHGLLGATKCQVCGESDLSYPADCQRSYQYECGLQYSSGTPVYCLTRQTRLSSGLFSIEKRCVSEQEHREHYPGHDTLMDGCSSAWDGQVEYCICQSDLCNQFNMTEQQRQFRVANPLPETDIQTTPFRLQTSPPVRLTTTPQTITIRSPNVVDPTTTPLHKLKPIPERTQPTTAIRNTVTPSPETLPTTKAVLRNRATRPTENPPSRQRQKTKEITSAANQAILSMTLFVLSLLIRM